MREIPFSRPSLGQEEIDAVGAVLRSGWLTTGAEALAFEQEFAHRVGTRHALAVNSATAGLHLALEACGVGPNAVVIVPSLTFTATAEVARYLGAQVEFADIDPATLLIDPEDVARRAQGIADSGRRIGAIIPVHLAGAVCNPGPLRVIAHRHDAALIEDAAHAFPSPTTDGYAGTLGDIGVYSFYANKTITTGEGGMVCTDDDRLAARIRTMRLHGIDREAWDRYRSTRGGWYYQVVAPGYKYNMPDTAAAIGRVQLRRADDLHRRRRDRARYYLDTLRERIPPSELQLPADSAGHAWHLFIVQLASRYNRDRILEGLSAAGIGISVHYTPLHRMKYWAEQYGVSDADLPHTTAVADQIFSLPLYPDLTADDQDYVVATLSGLLREAR